jgi:preprotein translocase subunit SecG
MFIALTVLQVLVALVLILFVLLQSARGTDLAGAFGGMGSQAAFGPRGTATFLSKATVVLAVIFMANSLALAILSNRQESGGRSILSGEEASPQSAPAPSATPGLPPGTQVEVTPPVPQQAPAGEQAPANAEGNAPAGAASGNPPASAPPPSEPAAPQPSSNP